MNKKAAIGIGTLIIFISAILTASVSAGVLLHTQSQLQNEALKAGTDTREAVGTSVLIEKVLGEDISGNKINKIKMRARLGPSSSAIKFNDTTIALVSQNVSSTFNYIGNNVSAIFTNKANRPIEWDITSSKTRLKTDLDGDYKEDHIFVASNTILTIDFSTLNNINITIPDISTINTEFNNTEFDIMTTRRLGTLHINGNNSAVGRLNSSMDISLIPDNMLSGVGGYAVTYSMRGKRNITDALVYGDITWIHFETSAPLYEGGDIVLNMYTPKGVPAMKEMKLPDTIVSGTVSIFP